MRRLIALMLLALAVPGCENATGPGTGIAGKWFGTDGESEVTLSLQENTGNVTGKGNIKALGTTAPLIVTGTFAGSTLDLVATVPGYGSATYAGTLMGDTIVGVISGIGFVDTEFELHRR